MYAKGLECELMAPILGSLRTYPLLAVQLAESRFILVLPRTSHL